MDDRAIMVLGYRKRLVEAIRGRGFTPVIVADKYKSEFAHEEYRLVPNLQDGMAAVREGLTIAPERLQGATTGHEQGVFPLACVRNALGLPAQYTLATALKFRDKYIQKTSLSPGIARPDCFDLVPEAYPEVRRRLDEGQAVVVKPAAGASTIDTYKISTRDEFETLLPILESSPARRFVVEAFSPGEEHDADGWFRDGRLVWFSIARYLAPMLDSKVGKTMAILFLRREDHRDLYAQFEAFLTEALGSLSIPDAVFHCEVFLHQGRIVFGECAIRPGGAFIPETLKHMYGVDLFDVSVDVALGTASPSEVQPAEMNYGIILFRPPLDLEGTRLSRADLENHFDFVELEYESAEFSAGYSSIARIGYAIVRDPQEHVLLTRMQQIIAFSETGHAG